MLMLRYVVCGHLKEGRVKSASLSRYKERKGECFWKRNETTQQKQKVKSITNCPHNSAWKGYVELGSRRKIWRCQEVAITGLIRFHKMSWGSYAGERWRVELPIQRVSWHQGLTPSIAITPSSTTPASHLHILHSRHGSSRVEHDWVRIHRTITHRHRHRHQSVLWRKSRPSTWRLKVLWWWQRRSSARYDGLRLWRSWSWSLLMFCGLKW